MFTFTFILFIGKVNDYGAKGLNTPVNLSHSYRKKLLTYYILQAYFEPR